MPLACVGLSCRTTPLAIREQLAFSHDEAHRLLSTLDRGQAWAAGIGEAVLVSTCNRTELYLASRGPAERMSSVPGIVVDLLVRSRGLDHEAVRTHLRHRIGDAAVAHLCRVASGLNSMVVGEPEVLGQVVAAHGIAANAGTTGLILDAAFRAAIRAGRRARIETGVGRAATSVAGETVRLLETLVVSSDKPAVVLVGAGHVARRLAEILTSRGFPPPVIVGRTPGRTADLAGSVGGRARPWHELPAAVIEADVVISATAAPHEVLTAALVADAARSRAPARQLHCVDLGVPRDIEQAVRTIDGVTLHDLDDLQARIAQNRELREAERPRVEAIIDQEVAHFRAWLHGARLRPLLSAIHARGEEIRRQELERAMRHPASADPAFREVLDRLSRAIVAKLLHGPSARLRIETDPQRSRQYADVIQNLFGLAVDGDGRFAGPP